MLIKRKKNKGFTLVEVIVSMLVLSITIVSVLTAFSLSAKSNTLTKKIQSAESLMEDLVEYTKAYTKDLDPEKSLKDMNFYDGLVFEYDTCTTEQALSNTETVEITTYENMKNGLYKYKVEVTRDTEPSDYTELNDHGVVSFGAEGSNTALIDISVKGNDMIDADGNAGTNGVNDYDDMAAKMFWELHCAQLDQQYAEELAALGGATPIPTQTPNPTLEEVINMGIIDREIRLVTESPAADKMQLKVYIDYELTKDDTEFPLPTGTERVITIPLYTSAIFDAASVTTSGSQKLDQIYILYSPWEKEELGASRNNDVHIIDSLSLLGADIYLVYQDTTSDTVAEVYNSPLNTRFNSKKICVEMEGVFNRVDLYSSAEIERDGLGSGTIVLHSYDLVSTSQEIRVQEVKIRIIDPDSNKELASTTIACLR